MGTPKSAPENGINDLDHPEISDGFQISVWERYVRKVFAAAKTSPERYC